MRTIIERTRNIGAILMFLAVFSFSGCSPKVEEAVSQPAPAAPATPETSNENNPPPTIDAKIVVMKDPVQCMGNAWEKDWLKRNNKKPGDFPRDQEDRIITEYYTRQGVPVHRVRFKQTHENVCEACDCPRGDTVYMTINESDAPKMISLGFARQLDMD